MLSMQACNGSGQTTPNAAPATDAAHATPTPVATPVASTTSAASSTSASEDWPLFDQDAAHDGANDTTTPPLPTGLTKLWQVNLGNIASSGPIVVGSMLYVTTQNGTTYGISTTNGAKVWSFTTTGPGITTAGPAYDEATQKLFAPGVDGKVHQLDPVTGAEITAGGFPVTITLLPSKEKDASPLNVANGYVYAQTSAYDGDATPYVGHVAAMSEANGQLQVFNTLCAGRTGLIQPSTCDQNKSGMWSRAGIVVDDDPSMNGEIYGATGNGLYDAASGDYGDSVIGLDENGGTMIGNFTPSDTVTDDEDDLDLGSTSPALIPRQSSSTTPLMAVQGGKDSMLRLLNRTNLGGANAQLQAIALSARVYSAPAVHQFSNGSTYVYLGLPTGVTAYIVSTTGGTSQLKQAWTASIPLGYEGTSPAYREGVLYLAATNELVALNALTGAVLATSGALGNVHWESPAIARGVVYCADESSNLTAFEIVRPAPSVSHL